MTVVTMMLNVEEKASAKTAIINFTSSLKFGNLGSTVLTSSIAKAGERSPISTTCALLAAKRKASSRATPGPVDIWTGPITLKVIANNATS